MNATTLGFVAAFVSYLIGALPFGYLTAKLVAGIDIRQRGSGNIGATNVARTIGLRWGILVLIADALKGLLPVYVLPRLLIGASSEPAFQHVAVVCGVATVIGHMFPVYLKFRGGKGVATSLGVVAVLAPWATLISVGFYLMILLTIRIPSVASMVGSIAFAIARLGLTAEPFSSMEWSRTLFSLLAPVLIIIRHRTNIGRILRGEEPRFRFGKKSDDTPPENSEDGTGQNSPLPENADMPVETSESAAAAVPMGNGVSRNGHHSGSGSNGHPARSGHNGEATPEKGTTDNGKARSEPVPAPAAQKENGQPGRPSVL